MDHFKSVSAKILRSMSCLHLSILIQLAINQALADGPHIQIEEDMDIFFVRTTDSFY